MRQVLIGILLVGFCAALGGVWLLVNRRPAAQVTFADGTRIEFLGSAVGGAMFTTERPWEKRLRRFLPARWLGFLPPALSGSCGGGSNSVTFYFREFRGSPYHPWSNFAARDSAGFLYPPEVGGCGFGGTGGSQFTGLTLRAYPRRQNEFNCEFVDSKGQASATLRLPNPVRGPFPEWTPRPMPLSLTNGPVMLTLESLRMPTNNNWRSSLQPKWRIQSSDPHWRQATAGDATVSDPTGNEGAFSSFQEKAWRLTTHVHRSRWEDFEPSERLVLTNLTLPAGGEFVPIDASARLAGVEVNVEALCSAGTFSITNSPTNGVTRGMSSDCGSSSSLYHNGNGFSHEHWAMLRPSLFVEVKGMQGDDELRFRAFDERNHEVELESSYYERRQFGNQARVYTPSFMTLTNGVIARLEFVVSLALDFEFCVNPAEVTRERLGP